MCRKDLPERDDFVTHINVLHTSQRVTLIDMGILVKRQKYLDSHQRCGRGDN